MKGIFGHRKINPMKSKVILILYAFISAIKRSSALILYFSPALGLFNLLRHLQAEQAPFLQTYNGTKYYDANATQYIMEMNLQRGKWRPWSNVNEFLGYDPPDVTVYTGISA